MWARIDGKRLARLLKYASDRPQIRLSRVAIGPPPRHQQTTDRLWSLSPDPPITPVRAWMRLVNRVDKPQILTRGARVRCSKGPVTEMGPVVDESVIPEVVR
jgi:hypothetical protein